MRFNAGMRSLIFCGSGMTGIVGVLIVRWVSVCYFYWLLLITAVLYHRVLWYYHTGIVMMCPGRWAVYRRCYRYLAGSALSESNYL